MKLTILRDKLRKGLSITERACSKSVTLPVLNHLLFHAEKSFLKLSATDLEIAINWWGLAKIEKEGSLLLPPKVISPFISLLPEKPILLEKENFSVSLECDFYRTKIKGHSSEEFPIIPKISEPEFISLPGQIFSKNLEKVVEFVSPSTTRPEISGVYLIFGKDSIKFVATDSFRLGEKTFLLSKPNPFGREIGLIIPQRAAREIINIFGDLEREIKIYQSANQIAFESEMEETPHPEILLTSRLIEGDFPDYEAIIPRKFETEVILFKEEFLKQIKTASIFSGKSNEIKLKIDSEKKELEILSENPELGSYRSLLKSEVKGKNLIISFNHRFLTEGISQIEGEKIVFQLTDGEGPALLKPLDHQDFFYVLMPIKIS